MILGIGHDIVYLPRFVTLLRSRSPRRVQRLAERVLHPVHERPQFDAALTAAAAAISSTSTSTATTTTTTTSDPSADSASNDLVKAAHLLANAWACKEALYKALDTADQPECRFNAWYKYRLNGGGAGAGGGRSSKPAIACDAYAAARPAETFWLSVSHDGDYLTAFVVREGN